MTNITVQEILAAPDVHHWAKRILREALDQDIVDALKDLELVHDIVLAQYRGMVEAAKR